ncbi:permease [Brevibacillus sp. LEMMJ03]|uniref:permease n=1 Tax=Brevibacillus sp. LEMMJ03 TaxID=2595056 RepID=UPI00117C1C67|nr:permease [Brevibacillus sp. LEMMJ03]TRY22491.1 permease [Brevibacillus sp. LEMMJ03]
MFWDVLQSFFSITIELTLLFVVISLLINLIQGFIPYDKLNQYLSGKNTVLGALAALLFAFVTPFCSCSTIPVVVNLLNKKVRFGIVMVFLFSSPVLDPTIITLMGAMLGVKVAVAYTVITSVLSVIIGFTLEKLGFEKAVKRVVMTGFEEKTNTFSWKSAWSETVGLMKTVYPYLIIGAAIGSVIHGVVPTEWISSMFGGNQWWLVPVAAAIGIPLYVRLSMMIPMSQILIAKGMAIAPVMALMISSAGASLPEVTLLNTIFQKRLVVAFVASVMMMATLSGFLFYFI